MIKTTQDLIVALLSERRNTSAEATVKKLFPHLFEAGNRDLQRIMRLKKINTTELKALTGLNKNTIARCRNNPNQPVTRDTAAKLMAALRVDRLSVLGLTYVEGGESE